ncbi:uncharacterized protein MONBRDRAFT_34500 [Monosiga brevicollis MX1]|uniref:C2HC/C3H-type domain-containing protein n=1 Tax=Monosiga brevicollis TaxID=81824 RepID=A9VC46_MONBE|nr:uncharacterized protein MONBRDRAFT_34500 [Monosiga brevicollis MX1]EDQ84918.1 predicted protein [Monosiga brevicollis MX1]|eukprot:XP_001750259.1 hypothetical protein [Monosiga brevicollis MX1]
MAMEYENYDGNIDFSQEAPMSRVQLHPCSTCGRTFNEKALGKHAPICSKTHANAARRGTFNSTRQRVEELEVKPAGTGFQASATTRPARTTRTVAKPTRAKTADTRPPPERASVAPATSNKPATTSKGDWRSKREQFLANLRAARQVTAHLKAGGDIRDLPPPTVDEHPEYVSCPTCNRRFNEDAAKRHIKFCAEQAKRASIKRNGSTKGGAKAEAVRRRTAYKPPLPGAKSSSSSVQPSPAHQRAYGDQQAPSINGQRYDSEPTPERTSKPQPPSSAAPRRRGVPADSGARASTVRRTNGTANTASRHAVEAPYATTLARLRLIPTAAFNAHTPSARPSLSTGF